MDLQIGENASIKSLTYGQKRIPFRTDSHRTAVYLVINKKTFFAQWKQESPTDFSAVLGDLQISLGYRVLKNALGISVRIRNSSKNSVFKPTTVGLKTGIDCYMETYPNWKSNYFPTMLRCEKTHFWGYCMSPEGDILTITCPQPIASWSLDYNELDYLGYLNGGHRIYTCNIHLLNRLPKPSRHPQLDELLPLEEKTWDIMLSPVVHLSDVYKHCSALTGAPMISIDRYTLDQGESTKGIVYGAEGQIEFMDPSGNIKLLSLKNGEFVTPPVKMVGIHKILAYRNGKVSEALIYQKRQNSWYLDKARDEFLKHPPVYTHHMEAFDSLFTVLLARKVLPEKNKDAICETHFQNIFQKLYNFDKNEVNETPQRIQDSAALSCLMARRYLITKNPQDLRYAGCLADFLLSCQKDDGAYYSQYCSEDRGYAVHYTAVTYIAKYIAETASVENLASKTYPEFLSLAERHRDSAERAIKNLYELRDNIDTEGEATFEDGMISCSMLQITEAALAMKSSEKNNTKDDYTACGEYMYQLHRCLTQHLIPDCRMNGCTLRFWEAQYNLNIFHNAMSSPCGWTAWKLYGVYNLYLLTGKRFYLIDLINGMGACLQLIDGESGRLRWGFLCDPYIETQRYVQQGQGQERGKLVNDILCEQYVDMISGWHRTEPFPRNKWSIDNLVFEIFKCMGDLTLQNAFVCENEDGTLLAYNCCAKRKCDVVEIEPNETLVTRVHCNFKKETPVVIRHRTNSIKKQVHFGWIELQSSTAEEKCLCDISIGK